MSFNPDSISQERLSELQRAAELAWGEDTRHPAYQGHPDPSQGCCYVTSRWLQKRLGGFVGIKRGHYFWVSPDKEYIIDLTGDLFSKPPIDPSVDGQTDESGDLIRLEPHHKRWMLGPSVYVRSTHPLYRDFRIVPNTKHDRSEVFAKRADAYMRGGVLKQADLMGPTAHPGETPQKQEDWQNNGPMIHDEPTSMSDPAEEYRFVFANGQLHVSPVHDHNELLNFAGTSDQSNGPITVGYGKVIDGSVTWFVTSNMALNNVHQQLEEFSDSIGWNFEGMLDSHGEPIDDSFGAKKSMWYKTRPDGHLVIAKTPLPHGRKIDIIANMANCLEEVGSARAAIQEWAEDFGYKLTWRPQATYPGGGNMLDKMKNMPHLDQHNLGDQDAEPESELGDISQANNLECESCGAKFDKINELILHDKDVHHPDMSQVPQDPFPKTPFERNQQVDFGTQPIGESAWNGLEGA
jgi:hypothetical protein